MEETPLESVSCAETVTIDGNREKPSKYLLPLMASVAAVKAGQYEVSNSIVDQETLPCTPSELRSQATCISLPTIRDDSHYVVD